MFYFILRNFVLFLWGFNGGNSKKEDLQMVLLKSEEKMVENIRGGDVFKTSWCALCTSSNATKNRVHHRHFT